MSFAKILTRGVLGLHAPQIEVEVHLSQGLPSLTIVGLPEAAVRESKDRVRSAIINSGFQFPSKRLTINLAPKRFAQRWVTFRPSHCLGNFGRIWTTPRRLHQWL